MLDRRKRIIGAGLTLLVLGVVGLVYAAWITNGSGSGSTKAGQAADLSTNDVSATVSTVPNKLYPSSDGDVRIQIHNPNPYPVTVTAVNFDSSNPFSSTDPNGIVATGGTGTCGTLAAPSGVTFTNQSTSINVPANGNSATQTLTNAAHMSNASATGCQTATFQIPVLLEGASA